MNFLVTGGGGYLGSGLLLRLGQEFQEATITSMDNLTRGDYSHVPYLKNDVRYQLLVGDITKKRDLRKALTKDTTIVIHTAAIPGVEMCEKLPKKALNTNVYGSHLLLAEIARYDVERFVFLSSAAVYGIPQQQPITETHPLKPINLYGVIKVSVEQLVNASHITHGLTTTILRLSNVYGVSAYTRWRNVIPKFVWQAVNGQPLTIRGDGKQQRNYVNVQDVIDALIECIKAPRHVVAGETFNIGGEDLSVNQIAETVAQEAQRKLGEKALKVYVPQVAGEVYTPKFSYSFEKAWKKFGYKPKRTIREGIQELFDYALKTKATGLL